jgi:hypothetical protein
MSCIFVCVVYVFSFFQKADALEFSKNKNIQNATSFIGGGNRSAWR